MTRRRPIHIRCHQCGLRYTRQSSLNRHNLSKHSPNGPGFSCNVCLKSFLRKDGLRRHQRKIHVNNATANGRVNGTLTTQALAVKELNESSNVVKSNNANPFDPHDESIHNNFLFDQNFIDTLDPTWWLSADLDVDDGLLLSSNSINNDQLPGPSFSGPQYMYETHGVRDNGQHPFDNNRNPGLTRYEVDVHNTHPSNKDNANKAGELRPIDDLARIRTSWAANNPLYGPQYEQS